MKITYKGKLSIQSTQSAKMTVTGQGFKQVEMKSQKETETAFGKLVHETKITNFDPKNKKITLSSGLTLKSNLPNSIEIQLSKDVNERGQIVLKGSVKNTLVKGKLNQNLFTSNEIEISVEVTPENNKKYSLEDSLLDLAQSTYATGILITAVGIVVGTIAEDIITLGWGVADDPISFAIAYGMARYSFQILSTAGRRVMTQGLKQTRKAYKNIESSAKDIYNMGLRSFDGAYSWAASTPLFIAVEDLISDEK